MNMRSIESRKSRCDECNYCHLADEHAHFKKVLSCLGDKDELDSLLQARVTRWREKDEMERTSVRHEHFRKLQEQNCLEWERSFLSQKEEDQKSVFSLVVVHAFVWLVSKVFRRTK